MSCYLGFEPTDRPNYYFVSYNSEDIDRISPIAKSVFHAGVPLWYDFGLEYGEKWESQISGKIMNSQAILLFFTKGILMKQNSYVRKEYEMATKFFDRKVFVVMMDKIENKNVPFDKVPWWIDLQERQSIDVSDTTDIDVIVSRISQAIGMQTSEERMCHLIENYKSLYDAGRRNEAEAYLAEYLHGQSLAGKAQTIRNIIHRRIEGLKALCATEIREKLKTELIDHAGNRRDSFFECHRIAIDEIVFTIGNSFIFHRGNLGDAHVINIWRNDELIYTVGGLIEANNTQAYYDHNDDIIYICFSSAKEEVVAGEVEETFFTTTVTVENPKTDAVCTLFKETI